MDKEHFNKIYIYIGHGIINATSIQKTQLGTLKSHGEEKTFQYSEININKTQKSNNHKAYSMMGIN